jgi:hypothetical protein
MEGQLVVFAVERVDLHMQRQTLHSLLIAKVRAEALHRNADLHHREMNMFATGIYLHVRLLGGIPKELDGVMSDLLDLADHPRTVLRVDLQNALLHTVLSGVPKLPGFNLFIIGFVFAKDDHQLRLKQNNNFDKCLRRSP